MVCFVSFEVVEEAGEGVGAEGDLLAFDDGLLWRVAWLWGWGWELWAAPHALGCVACADEVLGGDLVGGALEGGGVGDVVAVGEPGFVGVGGGVLDGDGLHGCDGRGRVGGCQVVGL